MKKKLLLLLLTMLFLTWEGKAQSLTTVTVCDGYASSIYIPVYGLYVDTQGCTCEFIIPSTTEGMDEMVGGTISKMTFHLEAPANGPWAGATFRVYLAEVNYTTLNGITGPDNCTVVYTGPLDGTQTTMEVSFSQNFLYHGGNLLIGTYVLTASNEWKTATFHGTTASHAAYYHYGNNISSQDFIPMTTFTYTPAPGYCEKPQNLQVTWDYDPSTGYTTPGLQWDAMGSNTLFNVQYKKNSETQWTVKEANYSGTSVTLDNLTPATDYNARVQHICDAIHTSGWVYADFTTSCDGINLTTSSYEENFNSYYVNVSSTGSPTNYPDDVLPNCWRFLNRSESIYTYPQAFLTSSYEYAVTGNCLLFKSSNTTPLYAILPEFDNPTSSLRLTFTYRNESTLSINGTLHVGYMTNPTDAATYQNLYDYAITTTKTTISAEFPNAPNNSFIVFKYEGSTESNYYLSIDNVSVEVIPSCTPPTGLQIQSNSLTSHSVTFEWNANSGDSFEYALVEGHNIDPQNVNYSSSTISGNTYHYANLSPFTDYTFFLCKWCSQDDQSEGVSIEFATNCEIINTFPWSEDFESYNSGVNFDDPCWENEHITGTGTKVFQVHSGAISTNSTNKLCLPDQYEGTLTKLRLPEMTLPNNDFEFVIDVYRSINASEKTEEGIRVFVSTDGELDDATELAFIPRLYSVESGIIPAEAQGNLWYTYSIPIGVNGTCYIILRGENQYGANTYIDNFIVRPSNTGGTPIYHLSLGWNWWAPMVESNLETLNTILGNYIEQINTQDGEPIINVVPGEMYRILTNAECTFSLTGETPTTVAVYITPGYNWFGYAHSESVSISEVFDADFNPTTGDKIISQDDGFAVFNGTIWEGTLSTLQPGEGYVYVSQATETKTLVIE